MENKMEGWMKLDNAKTWHYFREGRSLCGKWMSFSHDYDETENIDSPDNCKACTNKRSKELSNPNPVSCRNGQGSNNTPDIIYDPAKSESQSKPDIDTTSVNAKTLLIEASQESASPDGKSSTASTQQTETGGGFTIINMDKITDKKD